MPLWFLAPVVIPFLAYTGALYWLSGHLERERRRAGDLRPVPAPFDPLTSHRWAGILLFEDVRTYRPPVHRAFLIARRSAALLPVGAITVAVLVGSPIGR